MGRLPPAKDGPGAVVRLDEPHGARPSPGRRSSSASTWAPPAPRPPLLDLATGTVLASVYRRTEGNPVEAAQALVAEIGEMLPNPVVAVGITGSGRDAAAAVFRAAYPDLGARLTVQNEIVAHATAAARLDPDGGRSISIVEIGGQDAKFINVEGGRVVDADMNRVCSAGTGSFLEEQALAHGVDDIAEFGRLAARSDGPPDLGQTCTVFVADVAAEALSDGFSRDDIFAGLQYSVVRNYRSRVMGQRRLLERVFFQGKPASDPALARTLAAVLERDVYVPADPGAMGAVGIALLAAGAFAGGDGHAPPPIDLARAARRPRWPVAASSSARTATAPTPAAWSSPRSTSSASVARSSAAGSAPSTTTSPPVGEKLPKDAPNPYREREELLLGLLAEESGPPATATLTRGAALRALPHRHAALLPHVPARLGYEVDVLRPGPDTLAEGDRRCAAPGACAPVKLLHGLAGRRRRRARGAALRASAPCPTPGDVTYTCPMAQGAPDMVARALVAEGSRTRVLRPILFETEGDGFDSPRGAAGAAARGARRSRRPPAPPAASSRGALPRRLRRGAGQPAPLRGWACGASASAPWPGRASTTTRWSSSSARPT